MLPANVIPIDAFRAWPVWCDRCHGEGFVLPTAVDRRYRAEIPTAVVMRFARPCGCGNWPDFARLQREFQISA